MPPTLPPARWALAPPFHPCPSAEASGRSDLCGAFPRVTPGGRYPPPSLPGVRTFLDPSGRGRPAVRACPILGNSPPVNASGCRRRALGASRRRRRSSGVPRTQGRKRRRNASSNVVPIPVAIAGRGGGCPEVAPVRSLAVARCPDGAAARREAPPVELRPRVGLAARRQIGMRDHSGRRDAPPREDAVEQFLERGHLRLGERRKPRERAGIGELDPDRARIHVRSPAPGAGAGVPGARLLGHQPPDPAVLGDQVVRRDFRGRVDQPLERGLGRRHGGMVQDHQRRQGSAAAGAEVGAGPVDDFHGLLGQRRCVTQPEGRLRCRGPRHCRTARPRTAACTPCRSAGC